jgi:hypothetical protein
LPSIKPVDLFMRASPLEKKKWMKAGALREMSTLMGREQKLADSSICNEKQKQTQNCFHEREGEVVSITAGTSPCQDAGC